MIPEEKSKNKEKIINALELVKEFMNSIKPNMRNYLEKYLNQNNMTFLCNFIADVLSENSTFIDEIFEVLENHTEIINFTLILLNGEKGKKFSGNDLFKYLSSILKIKRMDKVFNKLYQKYRDYLFDIIKIFPQEKNGKKTLAHVFIILKDFIKKYQDVLIELLFKLISHNGNNVLSAFDLKDFLFDNRTNTSFLRDIRVILTNKTLVREIRDLINFNNNITNTILEKILFDEKLINLIIDLLHKPTFVIEFINILANLTKPDYINKHVPKFLKNIINGNFEVKNTILTSFSNILREVLTKENLKNIINVGVSGALISLIYDDVIRYNITDSCKNLFEYTYFKPLKYVQNEFRFYFMKKFVFDSTKSKNDFLTYENCLNGVNKFKIIPYEVKPIFVVGRIIDKYNQSKLRNSSYYDKYQYMLSFCFPQGKNITNNKSLCTEEDYGKLILIFNGVSNNVYNATVTTFNITEEDLKRKANHFAYFSLIVIISALPLFISIFLKIYEKIKLSNPQKNEINNKLILENQNKTYEMIKSNDIQEREFLYREKAPKWFRFLNEYFNLSKNGSELFNFTLNQTNFNDFNGITYIKGILGIAMILNIFGHTFLALSNLLHKILGSYQFYYSLKEPSFILAFIGLRYCPRIIFSCSGYTLVYKFLNFIEHDSNFCFFKFLALQSYKFILLIIAVIYLRFCLYYIDTIFIKINNPISEAFDEELRQNNKGYFFNLISFLFYNIRDDKELFSNESAFMPYLYLPINEIFLFIVGIALISLGYKFKLRVDIIIIISFIVIYLFKFIFFIAYLYKKEMYSTLYFYLRGYGIFMLNPLFNLPSFLVGMYFGLVNFTIQKGINNLYEDDQFKEIELMEKE